MKSREVYGSVLLGEEESREEVLKAVGKALQELEINAGKDGILWDTVNITTDSLLQDVRTLTAAGPELSRLTRLDVRALAVVVSETETKR